MPTFGKRLPLAPFGTRLPRRNKALLDQVQQMTRVSGSGPGVVWTPAGPFFRDAGQQFRTGVTPEDGIPAFDGTTLYSATITDASISLNATDPTTATWATTSSTFDGFNLSSQPVSGNANTIYMYLWNAWVCVWEDCGET